MKLFQCFFGHKWKSISVEQGEFVFFKGGMGTVVLNKCNKCGEIKTKTINGHWTLEQLKEDCNEKG